jgi:hypothetical protein
MLSGKHKDEIKKFGLFIVTHTYATKKCILTTWSNSTETVYLGFDAGASGVAKIGSHGGWYEGKSASGWDACTSKVLDACFEGLFTVAKILVGQRIARDICRRVALHMQSHPW